MWELFKDKNEYNEKNIIGFLSSILDNNSPFASFGVDGVTTFNPGIWANIDSRL